MRLAIMQPYFLPYIGYFQLIQAVDVFVVYDNIKYTKKGWINRNRMLRNGQDAMFSLPLKRGSDHADVCERELAADFNRGQLLNQFREAYRKAPYFEQTFPLIEQVMACDDANLFGFLHHSIVKTYAHLGATAEIRISSSVPIDHELQNQDKVLALCKALGATTYVNAIGGVELYSSQAFQEQSIDLRFIRSKPFEYRQFGDAFVPWLSIVDVLMFNPLEAVRERVANGFDLIRGAE